MNLSGLNENLPKALALLEDFMKNAKGDKESYSKFVDLTMKGRTDDKTNQNRNFSMLIQYGMYGPYNQYRNILSEKELRDADPQMLPDMLKQLAGMEHTVMYYGPYTEKQLAALISKEHKTAKKLVPAPRSQHGAKAKNINCKSYI